MRTAVFLAIVFLLIAIVESSFLWIFDGWFSAIPLLTIAGFLVMQRIGLVEGSAWFFVLALMRYDLVSLVVAIIGPIFMHKVFSTRSMYALFGAGLSAFGVGIAVLFIFHSIAGIFFNVSFWNVSYGTLIVQEILLLPGLYVGVSLLRSFSHTVGSRISLRHNS